AATRWTRHGIAQPEYRRANSLGRIWKFYPVAYTVFFRMSAIYAHALVSQGHVAAIRSICEPCLLRMLQLSRPRHGCRPALRPIRGLLRRWQRIRKGHRTLLRSSHFANLQDETPGVARSRRKWCRLEFRNLRPSNLPLQARW